MSKIAKAAHQRRALIWVLIALCVLFFASSVTWPQKSNSGAKDVDLLLALAVDVSESISDEEAQLQRFGYAEALSDPLVVSAIQLGRLKRIAITYMEWSGMNEQTIVLPWTVLDSQKTAETIRDALTKLPISGGYWTSISNAIDRAHQLIAKSPHKSYRRVIDVSSDGRNNAGGPLADARQRALVNGITINGLAIRIRRKNLIMMPLPELDRYFRECVIGGMGAFSISVTRYDDFVKAVRRKLIREIAGITNPPGKVIRTAGKPRKIDLFCLEDPEDITPNKT